MSNIDTRTMKGGGGGDNDDAVVVFLFLFLALFYCPMKKLFP